LLHVKGRTSRVTFQVQSIHLWLGQKIHSYGRFGGCESCENAGFRRPRAHFGKKNGIPLASSIANSVYCAAVKKGSMASLLAWSHDVLFRLHPFSDSGGFPVASIGSNGTQISARSVFGVSLRRRSTINHQPRWATSVVGKHLATLPPIVIDLFAGRPSRYPLIKVLYCGRGGTALNHPTVTSTAGGVKDPLWINDGRGCQLHIILVVGNESAFAIRSRRKVSYFTVAKNEKSATF